jgi:hypothetical protein
MLGKILETLYTKVFINIIVNDSNSVVYVEVLSKDEAVSNEEKSFKTNSLDEHMQEYIERWVSESPYHYITFLDNTKEQGALPSCANASKYVDTKPLNLKCVNKSWAYYSSKDGIKDIKYNYKKVGLDFIFSPFVILSKFFQDKIDSTLGIFALLQESSITLCVFNNSQLLYAEYMSMDLNELVDEDLLLDSMEDEIALDLDGIDLDEVNPVDDISLSDFSDISDIEDLDSGIDLEEFSEGEDVVEEEEKEDEDIEFNEDYNRFILIQDSVNKFYHDDKYESEFIEHIYIADAVGVSSDMKKYLEEEMFLSVVVRKIALDHELCELAKAELS